MIKRMPIDARLVPGLIGAGGRTIREVRSKSRCDVQIPDVKEGDRFVEIEGRAEDVEVAVREVERAIERYQGSLDRDREQTNGVKANDESDKPRD